MNDKVLQQTPGADAGGEPLDTGQGFRADIERRWAKAGIRHGNYRLFVAETGFEQGSSFVRVYRGGLNGGLHD
jgi:hypothetical protein